MFPRSPRLVSFPCFSTAPSRFLSSFPRKLRGNHQFTGSEAGLGPKSANSRQIPGISRVYLENPIPGKYLVFILPVSSVSPQSSVLRFCRRPALGRRETRELPEWSTKHPLVSLEISGNEKCWGPCRFLFGFRKHGYRPSEGRKNQRLLVPNVLKRAEERRSRELAVDRCFPFTVRAAGGGAPLLLLQLPGDFFLSCQRGRTAPRTTDCWADAQPSRSASHSPPWAS